MNKIIVSIILAIILVIGINKITEVIYNVKKPEKSVYQVANTGTSTTSATETDSGSFQAEDIMALFASANIADGEKAFKKCAACHSIAKGGANKIGPALYNVIGRQAGSLSDYKYSKGMITYGKKWTPKELDGFLTKPKDWVKGTKMSFAGIKNPKERAALILYMNKNTDKPLSLQ